MGAGYKLAEWLNDNLDRLTTLTNDQIATRLGYTRPNIISMWRTGRTRIPLEQLSPLGEILGVELMFLLPLWLEQYMDKKGYKEVEAASKRLVSEEEAAFLDRVRKITGGKRFKMRPGSEQLIRSMIEVG